MFVNAAGRALRARGYLLRSNLSDVTDKTAARQALQAILSGHLYGLTLSNNGSDATNDIDIAVGEAADNSNTYLMRLTSALTKRLDAAWAVGTGNGGLDTGSIANGTYHVWLIQRSDTGVVDALFSTSASSPTMPTGYDRKRRVGSILRTATAGGIVGFLQYGDRFIRTTGPSLDVNATNPGTSAVTAAMGVPTGIVVEWVGTHTLDAGAGASPHLIVTTLAASDTAPSGNTSHANQPTSGVASQVSGSIVGVMTNTSAQIRYRVSASDGSVTVRLKTEGWIDTRGRLA